jgi:hypothetical protein
VPDGGGGLGTAPKKVPVQANKKEAIPGSPRSCVVTLTLSGGGAKLSYAEVLATARENVLLAEVGIQLVRMRKAITGAIILEDPGDEGEIRRPRLAQALDPATMRVAASTRTAKLRVVRIDTSVTKRELWDTLTVTGNIVLRRSK